MRKCAFWCLGHTRTHTSCTVLKGILHFLHFFFTPSWQQPEHQDILAQQCLGGNPGERDAWSLLLNLGEKRRQGAAEQHFAENN